MAGEWLANDQETAQVKRLLTQMGFPLENRVTQICNQFIRDLLISRDDVLYETGRVVYGSIDGPDPRREVDQSVVIYSPVEVNDPIKENVEIRLEVEIPIECKHRDGLEIFGFPQQRSPHLFTDTWFDQAMYPVISELARTGFVHALAGQHPPMVHGQPLCTIGSLEFPRPGQPRRSEEQLAYKAGASLYDYNRWMATHHSDAPQKSAVLESLGILESLEQYAETHELDLRDAVEPWMRHELSSEMVQMFNGSRFQNHQYVYPLRYVFPVVCVDAPLYLVEFAEDGSIEGFTPQSLLLTSLRLPSWPGDLWWRLLGRAPEALVALVHVDALRTVLDQALDWFDMLEDAVWEVPAEQVQRMVLHSELLESVVAMMKRSTN